MVEPVNLRQFRKLKKRAEKEKLAEDNRQKFGISTKLKQVAKAKNEINISKLDGAKLDKKDWHVCLKNTPSASVDTEPAIRLSLNFMRN